MKYINLSKGKVALVSDCDFHYLKELKWYAIKQGSSKFRAYNSNHKVYMHQLIMETVGQETVDHIDGNPLNNQRENLRICSFYENTRNTTKKGKLNTSKYKGVYLDNRKEPLVKRWVAQIKVDYKTYKLGRFLTEIEAAKAYDEAAKELWSDFASLNFKD